MSDQVRIALYVIVFVPCVFGLAGSGLWWMLRVTTGRPLVRLREAVAYSMMFGAAVAVGMVMIMSIAKEGF